MTDQEIEELARQRLATCVAPIPMPLRVGTELYLLDVDGQTVFS